MSILYNIYCDETCHLEFDHQPNMVLGAISAPKPLARHIHGLLKDLRLSHSLPSHREMKWGKVSPGKINYYLEALNLFFQFPELRFRAVIAPKHNLNHVALGKAHDDWYYTMYYYLLDALIDNRNEFAVYLDVKDDKGQPARDKLRTYLCHRNHDFQQERLIRIQGVQSHEVDLVQLVDLMIGAIAYANRPEGGQSQAKQALISKIRELSHYSLLRSTPRGEAKFNIFHWKPQELG